VARRKSLHGGSRRGGQAASRLCVSAAALEEC
jgi:hypothetical protein